MAREVITKGFGLGIYDLLNEELIPKASASKSLGWISKDGKEELMLGKLLIGAEEATAGYVKGLHFGYRPDGTTIHFRKISTKIQYYNTATLLWVDIVTGLTDSAEYTFSNYSSLSGNHVYATGIDGIYKINTVFPASYISLYVDTFNFKGKSIINKGRMLMWDLQNDKTGLYGSYIDAQDSTVYTTVTNEIVATGDGATTSFSGTLAFKGASPLATCFAISVNTNPATVTATDNLLGVISGTGLTGTINYTTGAWTLVFAVAPLLATTVRVTYQHESSNVKGVTDFRFTPGTRLAGEGFIFRQDEGGSAIQVVQIQDGSYISLKERSSYKLDIGATDLATGTTNEVFRSDIGLQYWRSSVATGKGIIFMDTSDSTSPKLTILQRNLTGDNIEPSYLASHFDFTNYLWDACSMISIGESIVFSGRTKSSATNNRIFIYNVRRNSVNVVPYTARVFSKEAGILYIGDSLSNNVYQVFTGYDDDNFTIENEWIGAGEKYDNEGLKRTKRLRIKGGITKSQSLKVYISFDEDEYQLIGTILGDGDYVDKTNPYTIGATVLGEAEIGGGSDSTIVAYNYYAELKINTTKFRKRKIKFVAEGLGYVSFDLIHDYKIERFNGRLPKKYRIKDNLNPDGTKVNLWTAEVSPWHLPRTWTYINY